MNSFRIITLRLGGLLVFLCLTLARSSAGADSVYIFPGDAPITVEYFVEGDTVDITLTNLSSQPVGEFCISQHTVSGASLLEASVDGQAMIPLLSESEFATVYAGMYTNRWTFAGFIQVTHIRLEALSHPAARTHWFTANPTVIFGLMVPEPPVACCEGRVGDANAIGGDEPTIGDISYLIEYLFILERPVDCPAEADVNQSGGVNPQPEDITLGDISMLIDYLFIQGPDSMELPPCP